MVGRWGLGCPAGESLKLQEKNGCNEDIRHSEKKNGRTPFEDKGPAPVHGDMAVRLVLAGIHDRAIGSIDPQYGSVTR